MGRFQETIDEAVRRREEQKKAVETAREEADKAARPLYEKVTPILQEAKSDLEQSEIEVDYRPNVDFKREPDREYLLFQLKPKTGNPTSAYRFSFYPKKGLFCVNRHPPQGRKVETLIDDSIDKVTDEQIVEIVRSAILEAYSN